MVMHVLRGINYLNNQVIKPDIVVFLDGDYSDYPEELTKLVNPIILNDIDFVIGARSKTLTRNTLYDTTTDIW